MNALVRTNVCSMRCTGILAVARAERAVRKRPSRGARTPPKLVTTQSFTVVTVVRICDISAILRFTSQFE